MKNEIIELLPSVQLKALIKETDHQFSENELLQIIYTYAPTLEKKLSLLERFSEIASADVSDLAKLYIYHEKEKLDRFANQTGNFVYELVIKETPDSCEEKYICSSYHSARACIDRFYEEYSDIGAVETQETRYRILKRKIFSDGDKFEEDEYGECVLGQYKAVISVEDYNNPTECENDIMCSECNELCYRRYTEVLYPRHVSALDVIKYSDYQGKIRYGVDLDTFNEPGDSMSEYYIIPFESSVIKDHEFEKDFYDHHHIDAPLATVISPDILDEVDKRNYYEFKDFLLSGKHKYIRIE